MFARYLSCPNGRNIRYRIGKKKKAVMTGRLSYLTEKKSKHNSIKHATVVSECIG